jgi:hypothetical protein
LKGTAGHPELCAQIVGLQNIVEQAAEVLQQNYAQMKLMSMEKKQLRIKLFQKACRRPVRRINPYLSQELLVI